MESEANVYHVYLTNPVDKTMKPPGRSHEQSRPTRANLEAPDGRSIPFCVDSGAGLSLIRRAVLQSFPDVEIRTMQDNSVTIHGVSEGNLNTKQFVNLPISLKTQNGEIVTVVGEVHVVDNLPVPFIMGNNIRGPNRIDIVCDSPAGTPALKVQGKFVTAHESPFPDPNEPKPVKVKVRAEKTVKIAPGTGRNIAVNFANVPPCDRGYLVEPEHGHEDLAIGEYGRLARAIISGSETCLPYANFGASTIRIRKGEVLGYVEDMPVAFKDEAEVYVAMESIFQGMPEIDDDPMDEPPAGTPFNIHPIEDDADLDKANVSDHWGSEYQMKVVRILKRRKKLFRKEMGLFNDGIKMPIPFREDADLTKLKQAPYNLSKRDEEAIDAIIDPLVAQGRVKKVPLGQPSAAASPAFVVWKNNKPRVVVDLRRVNTAVYPDAYPLPKQDTILSALGGAVIFSSLDIVKSFFQQPIAEEDQWKTAFVSPKRGQEMLTVATMGLINSPGFFQHRMENLLAAYLWIFVLVYIDDILIFSKSIEAHLDHLGKALGLLEASGITLSISKCHFAFPSIQALGHHVSRLGLGTVQEKTDAIRQLLFPENLALLEVAIGLFNYYRKFVEWFAAICLSLTNLKTKGFKDAPIKGYGREKHAQNTLLRNLATEEELRTCQEAFEELKTRLCNAPILAFPDFARAFILYVDGCKKKGFGAALHQLDESDPPKERVILYISKTLSPAEKRYWPTELETAALVWALHKLQQYTDQGQITVYSDHQSIAQTFKDNGPIKGKRSERLNNWRLYLARFQGRMEIIHKAGKEHRNADALSRLATASSVLTTRATSTQDEDWRMNIVEIQPEFRQMMADALPKDPRLGSIYRDIMTRIKKTEQEEGGPITTRESFRIDMDTKLMYQMSSTGHERLCIPAKLYRPVLATVHDKRAHQGVSRMINRLQQNVYIPGVRKVVEEYVYACPVCAATKPSRRPPLGELQPIETPTIPFAVQTIDIIVSLPETRTGMTAILTVTDKFSKAIKLVPGKDTYDAHDWAVAYFDYVYSQFGLPGKIISDRDPRWMSKFWKAIFTRAGAQLSMTAAYHPAADGQSERTNQTVEIALRSLLADRSQNKAISEWDELLPDTEYALNTFVNASTGYSPFHLLYGVPPRSEISPDRTQCPEADEFMEYRQQIRKEAADNLKAAQARMAKYFDNRHTPIKAMDRVWLKLARGTRTGYRLPNVSDLDVIKAGPFTVKRKVGKVAFELDLPESFKIHPVISCIHLEPTREDPFDRQAPPPPPVVVEGEERYLIDRILKKEQRRQPGDRARRVYYRVRWQGYGPKDDSWIEESELADQVPEMVEDFERSRATKRKK